MTEEFKEIKTKLEKGILTIYLEGAINKNSVELLEKQIFASIGSHPNTLPKFDGEGIKDITNEGLHLLKKIKDMIPIRLRIQNVSNEIYDLLNSAGFTEIYDIK